MSDAVAVIRLGLKDAWEDLWTVLVCNLIWLLSVLLIIPGPPATLALFYYTNRQAHGEFADLADFWQALRRYFAPAWRWGLINLVLVAILVGDMLLTGRLGRSSLTYLIQSFYLAVLGVWLIVQLYTLSFLIEQDQPGVVQAIRNGAVMLGQNIGFSISLGLLLAIVLLLGTLLFMLSFAVGGFLLASVGNHAVLNRLAAQPVALQEK